MMPLHRLLGRIGGRATARLQGSDVLAVVGGTSLALAVGVAFLPRLFPAGVFRPLSAVAASNAAVALFGALAGLLGVQALRESTASGEGGEDETDDEWTPGRTPERAHYDEYRVAGATVDAAFDADPDSDDLAAKRRTARNRIRSAALSVLAADENGDREVAARRIVEGSWTDDPRAAAFLGGRRHAPLRVRIRDWASGERFERWATRAVAEIEARKRGRYREEDDRENRGASDAGFEASEMVGEASEMVGEASDAGGKSSEMTGEASDVDSETSEADAEVSGADGERKRRGTATREREVFWR